MKNAIIAMIGMFIVLGPLGGLVSDFMIQQFGGGVVESYIYPLYGGVILLTGIVVGATTMVLNKLNELEKRMDDPKV